MGEERTSTPESRRNGLNNVEFDRPKPFTVLPGQLRKISAYASVICQCVELSDFPALLRYRSDTEALDTEK